jgi:hypothetical protein
VCIAGLGFSALGFIWSVRHLVFHLILLYGEQLAPGMPACLSVIWSVYHLVGSWLLGCLSVCHLVDSRLLECLPVSHLVDSWLLVCLSVRMPACLPARPPARPSVRL